jgi:hypothetical protein
MTCTRALAAWRMGLTHEPAPPCVWREDCDSIWETSCGRTWSFNDGGPEENECRFCHSCGRPIEAHGYESPFADKKESTP